MKPSITSTETLEVTPGQKESCVSLVTDAMRKAAGVAIDELAGRGVLNRQNIERVRARGDKVVAAVTRAVKEKFAELAENIAGCLKLISGAEDLFLEPADGKRTLAQAKELFAGWVDPGLENYGTNVPGKPTPRTQVAVYEMIKDGNFKKIFGGLDDDLDKLRFEQDQIIQFVEKYPGWLHPEGWATLFLFKVKFDEGTKDERQEYFVAYAGRNDGELELYVNRFSDVDVWYAVGRCRVVVPQLAVAQPT